MGTRTAAGPLRVGSALPDPPFELSRDGAVDGFDPAVMGAVADALGRPLQIDRYTGADFDGIFAGLDRGDYDVVASGATITDHRRTLARWCRPYVTSGQSLVVADDAIGSTGDLVGRTVGVQRGNTSEPVADALLAKDAVAHVRHYAYDEIGRALDDLEHGTIDAFMKLEPVMRWLLTDRPRLRIAQTRITDEQLAVAVRRNDRALADEVDGALDAMRQDGRLNALGRHWLGTDRPGCGTAVVT